MLPTFHTLNHWNWNLIDKYSRLKRKQSDIFKQFCQIDHRSVYLNFKLKDNTFFQSWKKHYRSLQGLKKISIRRTPSDCWKCLHLVINDVSIGAFQRSLFHYTFNEAFFITPYSRMFDQLLVSIITNLITWHYTIEPNQTETLLVLF